MRKFDVGYYPEFKLSENFPIPKELEERLKLAWNTYYDDFNEGCGDVLDECTDVLYYFSDEVKWYSVEHKRYVYMALAFVYASIPVIKRLRPEDDRPEKVLEIVDIWLKTESPKIEEWADKLFPEISTRVGGSFLDECYNNLYNLLKILTAPNFASYFISDIIYDAFTGEWAGGNLEGKRDIFNWWLINVIPAAYHLQLPLTIRPVIWEFPLSSETVEMFAERMEILESEEY